MTEKKARYRLIFARKGLNKNGKGLIQIEVYFNRHSRSLVSTNIFVAKNQWDEKNRKINQKHVNHIRLNEKINSLMAEIERYELDLLRAGKIFDKTALKRFFQDIGDDFFKIAKMNVNSDRNLGELSRARVLRHLNALKEVTGPLSVTQIDYGHIKAFDNFLKTQKYKQNTIANFHKDIKRTINALIKEGEMKKNPYAQFQIQKVKTRRIFLSPAEVDRLSKLSYTDKMQDTLDRFLISCGTGLRFSDVFMLHSRQIYEGEAGKGLVVDLERMKKVNFPVKNPAYLYFSGIADQRLRKYLKEDGFLFYRRQNLSAQNAIDNQNLKIIAMDAGISKPITFHTARHTALTEVAARTGNVFSVMKFGGIRKVDTAMIYVHLASEKF